MVCRLYRLGRPNGLLCGCCQTTKRAAQLSRPSWVVTVMPSDSGSIVGPARFPRGSPCSDGSTYAVCTLRGHALGTVVGSEWHGCCALVSPRCPWDGGGALIGSLQKVDRPVGRWRLGMLAEDASSWCGVSVVHWEQRYGLRRSVTLHQARIRFAVLLESLGIMRRTTNTPH